MQLSHGKYRGRDLAGIPTEYLRWAAVHLPLDGQMWDGVMAEYGRRLLKQRTDSETPAQKAWEKMEHPVNKVIARIVMRIRGY